MEVVFDHLEVALIGPGLRIEHDDGAGEQVVTDAILIGEVWRRIAARDVQQTGGRIERVRSPGRTPGDREAVRGPPGVRRFGRWIWCLRAAREISVALRYHVELPDNVAVLRVERVHAALDTLVVTAGVANENEALPRDRCRWHRLTPGGIRDGGCPQALTGLCRVRQHAAVGGAAIHAAVKPGEATVDFERAGGEILVSAPVLRAGIRIDREGIVLGRREQCAFDLHEAGLKTTLFA